jgi:hypothetical protein
VDVRHSGSPASPPPSPIISFQQSSAPSLPVLPSSITIITMASDKDTSAKDFYEDEKHLMKLCDFLRSSEGPPVREAIEMDKRVYYIKGAFWRYGLLQRTYWHGSSHQMNLILSWTIMK